MLKSDIITELDAVIDQKRGGSERYLVWDIVEPVDAQEFYSSIRLEILRIIDGMEEGKAFLDEHLSGYATAREFVEVLVEDFAKESAE